MLPGADDEQAPDGARVRRLCRTDGASMAHFTFPAGSVGRAIVHHRLAELWYITAGRGEVWREMSSEGGDILPLAPGMSFDIPPDCAFQVRAGADAPLEAVAVTLPPWSGDSEARVVTGKWAPSLPANRETQSG